MKKILRLFGIGSGVRKDIPVGLRGSGATGGKGLSNKFFNQALLESQVDHVINTETKVKETDPTEGTAYVDLTDGIIRDKDDVATVITDGDRIHWVEWETLTADIDLSAVDDIVHSTESGEILDLLTLNLLLGTGHSGFINATSSPTDETEGNISAVDSPELVVNNNRTEKLTDFKTSKDLVLNVASSTTATLKASTIRLLDLNNNGLLIKDVDETFNSATDLNAGTLYVSTWYQKWIGVDFLGNIQRLLVPDLESVADADVLNSLSDSTATFQTDAVQVGDEIYQTTDLIKGFVKAVSSETVITCKDEDGNDLDLFPLGTEGYKIRILSPQFDSGKVFKGRIGAAFRNSSGNFDDSTYTQIQAPKTYLGALTTAIDFTVSSSVGVTSVINATLAAKQINDWTGKGAWFVDGSIIYSVNAGARTGDTVAISGIAFKSGSNLDQAVTCYTDNNGGFMGHVFTNPGLTTITAFHASVTTNRYSFMLTEEECENKPSWVK